MTLCEKGHVGGEQSSRNWGWCRKMGRDPREIPLSIEALRLWSGMNARIGLETGFRTTGILYLAESEAQMADRAAWLDYARPYQLDSRAIGPAEVDALLPGNTRPYVGAVYTASDGRAEPQKAAPAIAAAARAKGAIVLQNCAVRGVETAGGRVSAVVTERGRIVTSQVVVAGGAWSRLFTLPLGLRLPQLKVRSTVLRTAPVEGGPTTAGWTNAVAWRKRLDGGYSLANGHGGIADIVPDSFRFFLDFLPALRAEWNSLHLRLGARFVEEFLNWRPAALDEVSPYERVRVLDPEPDMKGSLAAKKAFDANFPQLAGARVEQHWAGMIDATPDAVPVISSIDTMPGLFVATGFSGHGFGIGPGAGRLMAELVRGVTPVVDPTPFRFSRFTDGSKPRPIAGL
ncbi:4-methylaminobutanoate oxidase (formaldehyde-forming) [Methylobrevis pamukkalensis]|uniref:4-methylaminobutanoate oxidase (Formaldehyde-forming) n=1 Tax=Methylobrevis pamukkalensis TaxID=1439726 RepID=A0A1E3GX01_9HYPH|nr:4-methylaminobutanoate oxidase (formaldehyde-forming) [Methylobrevis pamukkalensis]